MPVTPKKSLESVSYFIQKIYNILSSEDHTEVIEWTPTGTSFVIREVKIFQSEILPLYFKHSNFSSFVRQLNMYGFHKVRGDRSDCEFEHEKFRRGQQEQLCKIRRKQSEALILSEPIIEEPALFSMIDSIEDKKNDESIKLQAMEDSNESEASKLKQIKARNKSLREVKTNLEVKHKAVASFDRNLTGEKFFKLITSFFVHKIRKQLGYPHIPREAEEEKTKARSLEEIISHVLDDSAPLKFSAYSETVVCLDDKKSDCSFILH